MSACALTLAEAALIMREAVKDKSYRALPLGQEAGHYLRFKRKRLTAKSYRDYESCLDKLARYFADLELEDFEPPIGAERIDEFMEAQWGQREPRTYNKNLSYLRDFFKFQVLRGRLHGDPTLAIERAKARGVHRETFTPSQRKSILAATPSLRHKLALRLLLDYGLRKGALQNVRFQHFDHHRRVLTAFTKGESIHTVAISGKLRRSVGLDDQGRELFEEYTNPFWLELERLILEAEARPHHYLMPRQKTHPVRFDPETKKAIEFRVIQFHDEPMGDHGLHDWWYECLERAGVVAIGQRSGERMHKARHTAGQRVLDRTGNLKAAQKLLGHASMSTTGDQYVDWDIRQLAETMADVLGEDES